MDPENDDKTTHMAALVQHIGRVRRRVASLLPNRADAIDDCVQQTMLEAFRTVDRHGPPQYPKKWLSRIAERVVYKNMRTRQATSAEAIADQHELGTPGSVIDGVMRTEDAERVRHALASLPQHDRATIEQHYWQGVSCPNIGRGDGVSTDSIKTRLYRGRVALRRRLTEDEQERSR